ncbi:MAG: hypothetical protein KZQ74_08410, partial [gamma proteobacterium symbiont of Bathyaustriella thionipta]|nr:hypothetical protein [gamma proteobacterium symbiont of Bathyaustriella thionipta]
MANYLDDKLTIRYPLLTIKKNKTPLIKNSGQIQINQLGDKEKQSIVVNGKLNSSISHLMNLGFIKQFTAHKLNNQSVMDAHYNLAITGKKLTINKSEFQILHPESKGQLILNTHKPISLSLDGKGHNFSQNGQLSFELNNFDIKPYESIIPDLPLSFDHINGHFELVQTSKKQKVILKQPVKIQNIHFKDSENTLLNPFNVTVDFAVKQNKNITRGEIKQLSINFINDTEKESAFDLQAKFKLDLDKEISLSELNGNLKLGMTQWLSQPAAMPDNTLSQGTLSSHFVMNNNHEITHQWLINNLVDKQGKKIVESISIDGTGHLENLSSIKLTMPIIMKSISGQSKLTVDTHTTLKGENKKISLNIDGQKVFLNDLLKLLATINPKSEISQLEADNNTNPDTNKKADNATLTTTRLNNKPAKEAFWKSGFDITAQLKINTLFYTDYMSYNDITGDLSMSNKRLHAKNFKIKFHESPMALDAKLDFNENQKKPYDIKFNTSLSNFS